MDDMGRVETNTDEIFDRIRTLGKVEPPPEQRLEEILKWLRKRGGVLLHDPDRRKIVAVKQFRFPTLNKGRAKGWLVEAVAGVISADPDGKPLETPVRDPRGP